LLSAPFASLAEVLPQNERTISLASRQLFAYITGFDWLETCGFDIGETNMKISFWLATIVTSAIILMTALGCEEKAADTRPGSEEFAQEVAKSQAEQTVVETAEAPLPQIVVETAVHDFGDVDPGSKNTGQFQFSNQGQGVLEIKKIQSTCGCTVPELKKKTYLPGESGTVTVTFRPGLRSGHVSKHLYILSNDKVNPKAKLTVKANVVQKISYEPKRFRLRPNEENVGVGDIKIRSLDNRAFAISRIRVQPECMKVDYDPVVEANEFVIKPVVETEKIKGMRNGKITITLTHPSQKTISIPFDLLPPFKSDPATLIALNADPDKPIRKTLYVLSNYGEDFDIESVSASNDAIKIISQEYLGDKYEIILDIVPPQNLGTKRYFNSKLTVDIAGGEKLVINCVGSISPKTAKKASN
jgi:hypothetical protein